MKKNWQKEWGEITLSKKGFKEIVSYFRKTLNVKIDIKSNIIVINKNICLNKKKSNMTWIAEGYSSVDDAHNDIINSSFWTWIHNEYIWKKNEVGTINLIEEKLKEKPEKNNPQKLKMSKILIKHNKCEELIFTTDDLHL
jgi:hypothetical protein